jgi:hypothetical protein
VPTAQDNKTWYRDDNGNRCSVEQVGSATALPNTAMEDMRNSDNARRATRAMPDELRDFIRVNRFALGRWDDWSHAEQEYLLGLWVQVDPDRTIEALSPINLAEIAALLFVDGCQVGALIANAVRIHYDELFRTIVDQIEEGP